MEICKTISELADCLLFARQSKKKIGFVPTMGALHAGHISLIDIAKKESDLVVCSIFVNPIQFTEQDDFDKYPRNVSADIMQLNEAGCDILFMPAINEMYPGPVNEVYNFGLLDKVMEGKFRSGHFNGVAIVVRRFFEIIKPDLAFFGEKDYQQFQVIKKLVEMLGLPISIIGCPIVREADGLAMSSRNIRLNTFERQVAAHIPQILIKSKSFALTNSPDNLKKIVLSEFKSISGLKPEYFEIADGNSLEAITSWQDSTAPMGFAAIYSGDIRLIDNIRYF